MTKLSKEPMKLTVSFPFFWPASLLIYACFATLYGYVLLSHIFEKCRQRHDIFYFFTFFSKMKCIVFSGFFFIWQRFFPSFQICTCVDMFSLKIAKSFISNGGQFFSVPLPVFLNSNSMYYIFNSLDENEFSFFI